MSARQTAVVYEALRRLPEMTIICLLMTLRLMALTATWLAPSVVSELLGRRLCNAGALT